MKSNSKLAINVRAKDILKIILAIHLAMIGFLGMDFIGLKILILRQSISFIYLIFIPGLLILKILKVQKSSAIETILYSVGLSLSFLMFTGLLMNTLYPLIGIAKPLSKEYLIITIILLISFLIFMCYIKERDFSAIHSFEIKDFPTNYVLFSLLIPFLSVFGAYSVLFYDNNILLLFLLVLISIIPIFVAFDKIPSKIYPLLIFVIAISLLYHKTLSSMYIQGCDLHIEYYFASIVKLNSYWNPLILHNCNCVLTNVILAPIFSQISALSLTWIFKIIYPLLFSLVPVALYQVYREQTNDKIAFFASFFFMSFFVFYDIMALLSNAKQMMAEFFFVLLMLLMVNKHMSDIKRVILVIIFAFSLIVAHYGTSYIFIIMLIFVWVLIRLNDKFNIISRDIINVTKHNFISLFIVVALAWYTYTAGSKPFESIVHIGDHIVNSIFTEFLNPLEGGAVYYIATELPLSWEILRILNYISQFFILLGIFYIAIQKLKHKETLLKFKNEYFFFSIACLVLLMSSMILPHSVGRGSMGLTRVYHLTLLFLAPFGIIGGLKIMSILANFINKSVHFGYTLSKPNAFKFLSVFFMLFLLFNSNFVSEIIQETYGNDYSPNPSISQSRIKQNGSVDEKILYYGCNYPEQDIYSAEWLGKYRNKNRKIFIDGFHSEHVLISYGMTQGETQNMGTLYIFPHTNIRKLEKNSYFYLRKINYIDDIMQVSHWRQRGYKKWWNTSDILPSLETDRNKIYSNGSSIIYN